MAMIRSGIRVAIGALGGLATLLSACASLDSADSTRLDLVKQRGELICGVSGTIPGMSLLRTDGGYEGFDIDICRAMAAAFLGDPDSIQYRPLTAPERFTALRSGIDALPQHHLQPQPRCLRW